MTDPVRDAPAARDRTVSVPAPRQPARTALLREPLGFQRQYDEAPKDLSVGAAFTNQLATLATSYLWLRVCSRLRTHSRGSLRDGFSPLALSWKCERPRIQALDRRDPGRSLGFA